MFHGETVHDSFRSAADEREKGGEGERETGMNWGWGGGVAED